MNEFLPRAQWLTLSIACLIAVKELLKDDKDTESKNYHRSNFSRFAIHSVGSNDDITLNCSIDPKSNYANCDTWTEIDDFTDPNNKKHLELLSWMIFQFGTYVVADNLKQHLLAATHIGQWMNLESLTFLFAVLEQHINAWPHELEFEMTQEAAHPNDKSKRQLYKNLKPKELKMKGKKFYKGHGISSDLGQARHDGILRYFQKVFYDQNEQARRNLDALNLSVEARVHKYCDENKDDTEELDELEEKRAKKRKQARDVDPIAKTIKKSKLEALLNSAGQGDHESNHGIVSV